MGPLGGSTYALEWHGHSIKSTFLTLVLFDCNGWLILNLKRVINAKIPNLGVKYKDVIVGSSWGESSRHFKMAAEPTREWSDEQLKSDDLPKKDVIKFIQDNAAHSVCLPMCCLCSISFK